jgi:hypothetical protein
MIEGRAIVTITAADIEEARRRGVMPFDVALVREYNVEMVRSNPVCAVMTLTDKVWLKVKFPFWMWDWGMKFINGGNPEPVTLTFNTYDTGVEESIIKDTRVDFRKVEYVTVPTIEAT